MAKKNNYNSQARRAFLRKARETDSLNCNFCPSKDLIINHMHDPEIPLHRRATVEHIIPVSSGHNAMDRGNWAVCCEKCNQQRNNDYRRFEHFLNKMAAK